MFHSNAKKQYFFGWFHLYTLVGCPITRKKGKGGRGEEKKEEKPDLPKITTLRMLITIQRDVKHWARPIVEKCPSYRNFLRSNIILTRKTHSPTEPISVKFLQDGHFVPYSTFSTESSALY